MLGIRSNRPIQSSSAPLTFFLPKEEGWEPRVTGRMTSEDDKKLNHFLQKRAPLEIVDTVMRPKVHELIIQVLNNKPPQNYLEFRQTESFLKTLVSIVTKLKSRFPAYTYPSNLMDHRSVLRKAIEMKRPYLFHKALPHTNPEDLGKAFHEAIYTEQIHHAETLLKRGVNPFVIDATSEHSTNQLERLADNAKSADVEKLVAALKPEIQANHTDDIVALRRRLRSAEHRHEALI